MILDRTEDVLICGSVDGTVSFLKIPSLTIIRIFDLSKHGSVRSFCNTTGA